MNPFPPVSKNKGYDNNNYKNTKSNCCKNGDCLFLSGETVAVIAACTIATIFFGGWKSTLLIRSAWNLWKPLTFVWYAFSVTALFTWTTIGVFPTALPETMRSLHTFVVAAILAVWAFRIADVTTESHTTLSLNASIGTTRLTRWALSMIQAKASHSTWRVTAYTATTSFSATAFQRILTFFP